MSFRIDDLNTRQLDVLREIGNIGSGNAATALAKMLNRRIDMDVPKVRILSFDEVTEIMGQEETIVVAVHMEVYGDIQGFFLFMVEYDSAYKLVNILMGNPIETPTEMDDIALSAIRETGNILTGSYIVAISVLTNLELKGTVAEVVIDMAGSIISVPAIEYAQYGDKMLYIEGDFYDGAEKVGGRILLVPEMSSYEKLLRALGVMD